MTVLNDDEWGFLGAIPEQDLVELAIDLDILVDAEIDHRELTGRCIQRIIESAPNDGLPFSKYDRDDLAALPAAHRRAIAELVGLRRDAGVDKIVRAGTKTWKAWQKRGHGQAIALLLPSMLRALARIAAEQRR